MNPMPVLFVGILAGVLLFLFLQYRRRTRFIAGFRFPLTVSRKVKATYPHLNDAQVARVMDGLRTYFAISLQSGGRMVSMPSQAVDVAWHEFILFTRAYEQFCRRALGRFLHHVPAEAMRSPQEAQDGVKRAWRLSCAREKIDPAAPAALPLLFALDQELQIADGFRYALDCGAALAAGEAAYCASHIGCGGGCGGASGGSDGDGDGGGCGGD